MGTFNYFGVPPTIVVGGSATATIVTSTHIRLVAGSVTENFYGVGLSVDQFGQATGGVLTGLDVLVNGALIYQGTGLNFDFVSAYFAALGGYLHSFLYGGNDVINGSAQSELLNGGAGQDTIYGNGGNDTLEAAYSAFDLEPDTLYGGQGNDVYIVAASDVVIELFQEGQDRVRSYGDYVLSDHIEELELIDGFNAIGNGLDNLIIGNAFDNVIDGGIGNDTLEGGYGDDTYHVDSPGDVIFDYGGVDTVVATSDHALADGLERLTLAGIAGVGYGNALDNLLIGNGSGNTLFGNGGHDTLDGGMGPDTMYGGSGDDHYVVDHSGDQTIEAGGEGTDSVSSSVTWVLANDIENLTLTGFDAIDATGNSGANAIYGNAALNTLSGAGGNDTLYGGGFDVMAGGSGDDTYYVYAGTDSVIEFAAEGFDVVYTGVSFSLPSFVERLVGQGIDRINLTGNSLDNELVGNDENNVIDGGAGADTMIGGIGSDTYMLADAGDVVVEIDDPNRFLGIDRVFSSVTVANGSLLDIEEITLIGSAAIDATGSSRRETITGNDAPNVLHGGFGAALGQPGDALLGGGGDDTLTTTEGNDTLDGGAGADVMSGGAGNDDYYVDHAADVVVEFDQGESPVVNTIYSSVTYTLPAYVTRLFLIGSAAIDATGNDLPNEIQGNANANVLNGIGDLDTLEGLGGDDTLIGGLGTVMRGGTGNDTYYTSDPFAALFGRLQEDFNSGTDRVYASVDFTLGPHFEQLFLASNALVANGNASNNLIVGNDMPNVLDGSGGIDTLQGGLGNDLYYVDNESDVVVELSGEGDDAVVLFGNASYNLDGTAVERLYLGESSFGNVNGFGNALDNLIQGTAGNNILAGGGGTDTLIGGAGNDTYVVQDLLDVLIENGNDPRDAVMTTLAAFTLPEGIEILYLDGSGDEGNGNDAANEIYGTPGPNLLRGYGGDDLLDGDAGADRMYGGTGNDGYFVDGQFDLVFEEPEGGIDTITSTQSFYLYQNVENLILTGLAQFGVGNALANSITGNDEQNLLIGWNGDDTLDGGGARDVLHGVEGHDTLYGRGGIDYIAAGNGNDTVYGGNDADEVYGQEGDDVVFGGDDFATDILVGGTGNDTIDGGPAWDLMYGNAGDDTFYVSQQVDWVFEQSGEGTDTVIAASPNGYYLYANIENLILAGSTPFGVGNALANVMTGNGLTNLMLGGDGADRLNGKGGNDVLYGQVGADTFVFERGTGGDVIADFVPGTDKIELVGIGYADFAQVQAHLVENGGTAALDLGAGDLIVLQNVAVAQLGTADFILL